MDFEIRSPRNQAEWNDYFNLRYNILRKPLGKEKGTERDKGDEAGTHLALLINGKISAIVRIDHFDEKTAQVRFVAVESDLQGKGYGKVIMEAAENQAVQMGYYEIVLHARDYAVDFYKRIGYTLIAPSHKLFGTLQHYKMTKKIN